MTIIDDPVPAQEPDPKETEQWFNQVRDILKIDVNPVKLQSYFVFNDKNGREVIRIHEDGRAEVPADFNLQMLSMAMADQMSAIREECTGIIEAIDGRICSDRPLDPYHEGFNGGYLAAKAEILAAIRKGK